MYMHMHMHIHIWPRARQCFVLGYHFFGATRHRVVMPVVIPHGRYDSSMAGLVCIPCYLAHGHIEALRVVYHVYIMFRKQLMGS